VSLELLLLLQSQATQTFFGLILMRNQTFLYQQAVQLDKFLLNLALIIMIQIGLTHPLVTQLLMVLLIFGKGGRVLRESLMGTIQQIDLKFYLMALALGLFLGKHSHLEQLLFLAMKVLSFYV